MPPTQPHLAGYFGPAVETLAWCVVGAAFGVLAGSALTLAWFLYAPNPRRK